jgi:hypothetical protein
VHHIVFFGVLWCEKGLSSHHYLFTTGIIRKIQEHHFIMGKKTKRKNRVTRGNGSGNASEWSNEASNAASDPNIHGDSSPTTEDLTRHLPIFKPDGQNFVLSDGQSIPQQDMFEALRIMNKDFPKSPTTLQQHASSASHDVATKHPTMPDGSWGCIVQEVTAFKYHQELQEKGLRICTLWPNYGGVMIHPDSQVLWLGTDHPQIEQHMLRRFRIRYPAIVQALARGEPLPPNLPRVAVACRPYATYDVLIPLLKRLALSVHNCDGGPALVSKTPLSQMREIASRRIDNFIRNQEKRRASHQDSPAKAALASASMDGEKPATKAQGQQGREDDTPLAPPPLPLDRLQQLQGLPPEQQRERITALQADFVKERTFVEPIHEPQQPRDPCQICHGSSRKMVTHYCGHVFCRKCIMRHGRKESTCPVCSKKLCFDIHFPSDLSVSDFDDYDVCFWCDHTGPKGMRVCEGCHEVGDIITYCSPECQKAAWKTHKWTSKAHREFPEKERSNPS